MKLDGFYVANSFFLVISKYISETGIMEETEKVRRREKKVRQERQITFETCNSTVCRLLHVCNVYDWKSEEASDN